MFIRMTLPRIILKDLYTIKQRTRTKQNQSKYFITGDNSEPIAGPFYRYTSDFILEYVFCRKVNISSKLLIRTLVNSH